MRVTQGSRGTNLHKHAADHYQEHTHNSESSSHGQGSDVWLLTLERVRCAFQDACFVGIASAMMSGLITVGAIDPLLFLRAGAPLMLPQ
eukprot:1176453-Rhodomonas_salina.3